MSNIPPLDEIPEMVKAIVAFMADIEEAKKVVTAIQANNTNKIQINIKGNPTNQGRYALEIEGDIPKDYGVSILQSIADLGGDIQVVAGK